MSEPRESPTSVVNPLLTVTELPDFPAVEPEHVVPGIRSLIASLDEELQNLEARAEPT